MWKQESANDEAKALPEAVQTCNSSKKKKNTLMFDKIFKSLIIFFSFICCNLGKTAKVEVN